MSNQVISTALIAGLVLAVISTPAAQAETIAMPEYTVGVSEAAFSSLVSDDVCTFYSVPQSEEGVRCTGVAANLFHGFPYGFGTVVVTRTETSGSMYTVSTEQFSADNQTLRVKPFLPNGFYHTASDYYWIVGNHRVRLTKATVRETFRAVAAAQLFRSLVDSQVIRTGVIPMDQADFDSLFGSGSLLRGRFLQEVIMNVDDGGSLYYLPQNLELTPRPIQVSGSAKEVWHVVKRFSIDINSDRISQIDWLDY